jgi:hypothetical protein
VNRHARDCSAGAEESVPFPGHVWCGVLLESLGGSEGPVMRHRLYEECRPCVRRASSSLHAFRSVDLTFMTEFVFVSFVFITERPLASMASVYIPGRQRSLRDEDADTRTVRKGFDSHRDPVNNGDAAVGRNL